MRKRLTLWRRRWCLWRKHPMADWSPIVVYRPARGTYPDYMVKPWRCALHDRITR